MTPTFLRAGLLGASAAFVAPAALAQCAGVPAGQTDQTAAAELVSLVGRGETRPSGDAAWERAVQAQKLKGGADMRTLALSSAALLLADRTQIRMSANAQLRLCDTQPERSLLELIAGRLWARTKRSPANLQLQTPAALAVVRGTDWDVEVEGSGRTTFTVLSGQVEFSNAYGRVDLGPSEQGIAVPGQAPTKRLLVNPRERVQWVMANPVDARRWAEFQGDAVAPELAAVQIDLDAGAWPQARERLMGLRQNGAHEAAVALVLADLAAFDARLETAVQELERAWQRTGDTRLAARRAEFLLALDRPEDARSVLDEALARSSSAASSDLLLADGDWYRLAGRGDESIARYRAGVARSQGNKQKADALGRLGRALQERGDLAAAREALAQAVALDPRSAHLLGAEATAATEALRLQEAGAGFDAALALQADDYESLAGAGYLALRRGEPEAARQLLLKSLVIEPRYARAHMWLAVAEYTLGAEGAALDALQRARQADPKDPLPWQIESILRNDSGESEAAIAAAREALVRLPYLKSLNPLASDSQGSANLGKALGDFGLEHWARAYAQQSYYPLWAGSHFFMANRYESPFARRSEFHQGYLADPLAFGASEKQAPVLLSNLGEWVGGGSVERNGTQTKAVADLGHHGLASSPFPIAWRVGIEGYSFDPRAGVLSDRLQSFDWRLGIGARPTDRLGLLLTHSAQRTRYHYPGGVDDADGQGVRMEGVTRSPVHRTDLGGSWRWSAVTSRPGWRCDRASLVREIAGAERSCRWGPLQLCQHRRYQTKGVMLRHTLQKARLPAFQRRAGKRGRVAQLGSALGVFGGVSTSAQIHGHPLTTCPGPRLEGQTSGSWAVAGCRRLWPRWSEVAIARLRYRSPGADGFAALHAPRPGDTGQARRAAAAPRGVVPLRARAGAACCLHRELCGPPAHLHARSGGRGCDSLSTTSTRLAGSLARKLRPAAGLGVRRAQFRRLPCHRDAGHIATSDLCGRGLLRAARRAAFDLTTESSRPGRLRCRCAQTSVDPYNGNPVFDRGRLHQLGLWRSTACSRRAGACWRGYIMELSSRSTRQYPMGHRQCAARVRRGIRLALASVLAAWRARL
jgi:tetratricopeptide (TPR) repeat protein